MHDQPTEAARPLVTEQYLTTVSDATPSTMAPSTMAPSTTAPANTSDGDDADVAVLVAQTKILETMIAETADKERLLTEMLAEVKARLASMRRLRQLSSLVNVEMGKARGGAGYSALVQEAQGAIQTQMDTMNEMSQEMSLRLQLAMDRQSKLMTSLSNILKKMSDTSSAIAGNLK